MTHLPPESARTANHLQDEASLYLRQHAENPVCWYPWGEEALHKAKAEDKPIFLSIGYAACHWCHVMEREVFENKQAARLLNAHFVSIKVDREERPDLDAAYMEALQLLTGGGGWPISLFLTPDLQPFWGATYIPLASFLELADRVHLVYHHQRPEIEHQTTVLADALARKLPLHAASPLTAENLQTIAQQALERVDPRWGGQLGAPKFPTPPLWTFLLHHYKKAGAEPLAQAVRRTLDAMSSGGLYDHLAGGFHRYAVDETWLVPHFEKMLYDNAQLASLYLEASVVFEHLPYAAVAQDTLDFLIREMSAAGRGFFASFDADSEDQEGAFYLWTPDQLTQAVGSQDSGPLCAHLGVTPRGNFEGQSILTRRPRPDEPTPSAASSAVSSQNELFLRRREDLRTFRDRRHKPTLDKKIITAWNGLTISALAQAFWVLGEQRYLAAAQKTTQYLRQHHRDADGRLLRASYDGQGAQQASLSDYALLLGGLLDLFQATQDLDLLHWARELIQQVQTYFGDEERGFFLTPHDHEAPLGRRRELIDSVRPSSNSALLQAMFRAAVLTADRSLLATVDRILAHYGPLLRRAEMAGWHDLAEKRLGPYYLVVIAGDQEDARLRELVQTFYRLHPAHGLLVVVAAAGPTAEQASLLPTTKDKMAIDGRSTAYLCQLDSCGPPIHEPGELVSQLRQRPS